ncbi:hypothetical protein HDU86_000419 [Geranomyces michiganensis]|nr:hypothetical protein HDU86_000419 [Geranomyces michiganensis]
MPAPNEAAEQAAHVWKQLDAMYAKSPKDYKTFISDLHREAEDLGIDNPLQPAVRGRLLIKSAEPASRGGSSSSSSSTASSPQKRRQSQRRWYVNVCESARVKPAKDATGAVSVVMSRARTGTEEDDGSPYDVYDAVVNPAIIREARADATFRADLIKLALECVEESFGVTLDRAGTTVTNDVYKGLYGWDDARGRPLKHGVQVPPETLGGLAAGPRSSLMTPQSLLARVRGSRGNSNSESESDDDGNSDPASKSKALPHKSPRLRVREREGVAPVGAIQDLDQSPKSHDSKASGLAPAREPDAAVMPIPMLNEPKHVEGQCGDGSWVLEVQLCKGTTASDIAATIISHPALKLEIKTRTCKLSRPIPADADATRARARFLAHCCVLQIRVPPVDARLSKLDISNIVI